jgi:ribosomal protein S18 acetylase RimI-like enzyme
MESASQAFEMMDIRNEVREFMTHNTAEIMPAEQAEWYRKTYLPARDRGEIFGYLVKNEDQTIGYGLISKRDGRWWVSGGLTEAARGQGAGYFLFEQMTLMIHEDLRSEEAWLDVLNSNEAAQHLYRKIGYTAVMSDERLTLMVHRLEHSEAECEAIREKVAA